MSTDTIFQYPPDNAALLYYQAFLMIERIDDTMLKTLADLLAGRIKLNEKIKEYIKRFRDKSSNQQYPSELLCASAQKQYLFFMLG